MGLWPLKRVFSQIRTWLTVNTFQPTDLRCMDTRASRELNSLRMNNRFEKITIFHCINFRKHLTYNEKEYRKNSKYWDMYV